IMPVVTFASRAMSTMVVRSTPRRASARQADDAMCRRRSSWSTILGMTPPAGSAAPPVRLALLGEGAGAFEQVLGAVDRGHGGAGIVDRERLVLGNRLGHAQYLLDGGVQERWAVGEGCGDLARPGQRLAGRYHVIDQPPVLRLGGVHPAPGHHELHRHVIGNAP